MTADLTNATVEIGPYTLGGSLVIASGAVQLTVTVDYAFPLPDQRVVGNARVMVDGRFVGEWFNGFVQSAIVGQRQTFTATIPLSAFEPGQATVSVGMWDNSPGNKNVVAFVDQEITIPVPVVPALVPGKFVRVLYQCDVNEIQNTPGLLDALKAAGVNTLSFGIFSNPADSHQPDFAGWDAQRLALIQPRLDFCRQNGFYALPTGDDFFRSTGEDLWLTSTPWAQQAVVATIQMCVASGVVVGIEMYDEVPDSPSQVGGVANFIQWVEGVPGFPPFAWPNQHPVQWENAADSTYDSRDWTDTDWRLGRETGRTGNEFLQGLQRADLDTGSVRPKLTQVAVTGDYYLKQTAGSNYTAPFDLLIKGSVRAQDIIGQCWIAAAYGACGVRAYSYDLQQWIQQRLNSVNGTQLQTGTRPGDPRWPGLAAGFNSLGSREAKLSCGFRPPVMVGNYWLYGFRKNLRWAVNTSESALPLNEAGALILSTGETPFVAGGLVPPMGVVVWGAA